MKKDVDKSYNCAIIDKKLEVIDRRFCMAKQEKENRVDPRPIEIILGVQAGSTECFDILKRMYEPLVKSMVRTFRGGISSSSELEREAESALLKAAVRYNCEQSEVAFGLYAKVCVRNALISLKRKEASRARREAKAIEAASKKRGNSRFSYIIGSMDTDKLVSGISDLLSPYEKRVFEEYMSGKSISEIAEAVEKSEKSVSNALYRIREKVRSLDFQ